MFITATTYTVVKFVLPNVSIDKNVVSSKNTGKISLTVSNHILITPAFFT